MSFKLEKKLIQYEKSTPISNDKELIKAIENILGKEESLPYEDRDFDLIDEAVEAILYLKGIDIGELEESAEQITDKYFTDIHANPEKIVKKSNTKFVRIKWLIPIAAIISILAAGTIAFAMGYDLIGMTKEAYTQLIEKFSHKEGEHELIITSDRKNYHSLSEFLEDETYASLLLPLDLPESYRIDSIRINDFGDHTEISISISNEESIHTMIIKTPYIRESNNSEKLKQVIGNHSVEYYQYDDKHQGEFVYEESYYTVMSSSYNSLRIIIESLRNNLQ